MRICPPERGPLGGKKAISGSLSTGPHLLLEHLLQVADFTLHLPACFFCRPAIAKFGFPVALPAFSFTLPFASLNPPLILSFVLDFIGTKSRAMNAAVVV